MVNLIQTGDTLATVWLWQVSNLVRVPNCVSAVARRKLMTLDTLHVLFLSLLFVPFSLIPSSAVKEEQNKQWLCFPMQVMLSVAENGSSSSRL